jgi:hypothetical protein
MGRVLFVLDLPLARFLTVVVLPGLAPYLAAGLLAWPIGRSVAALNRWGGAAVLGAAGLVYAVLVSAMLVQWVFTDAEKQRGRGMIQKGWGILRGVEATA